MAVHQLARGQQARPPRARSVPDGNPSPGDILVTSMISAPSRRDFLRIAAGAPVAAAAASFMTSTAAAQAPLYKISLAEWSINRPLFAGTMQHLDFAKIAKSVGIDAIEYVNQFFKDKAKDAAYLQRDERARAGRRRDAGADHGRRGGQPRRSGRREAADGGREPLQVGGRREGARLPTPCASTATAAARPKSR